MLRPTAAALPIRSCQPLKVAFIAGAISSMTLMKRAIPVGVAVTFFSNVTSSVTFITPAPPEASFVSEVAVAVAVAAAAVAVPDDEEDEEEDEEDALPVASALCTTPLAPAARPGTS